MALDKMQAEVRAQNMNIEAGETIYRAEKRGDGYVVGLIPEGERKILVTMFEEQREKGLSSFSSSKSSRPSEFESAQTAFYKEQASAMAKARKTEPTTQTVAGIPIPVSKETATKISTIEERRVKDATHEMDRLRDKYGKTGQETPEQIRDLISNESQRKLIQNDNDYASGKIDVKTYESRKRIINDDYGKWLKAEQTIREEGRLGYSTRGMIAATGLGASATKIGYGQAAEITSGTGASMKRRGVNPKAMLARTAPHVKAGGHPLIGSQYTGEQPQQGAYAVNVQKGSIGTERPAIANIAFGKGRGFASIPSGNKRLDFTGG